MDTNIYTTFDTCIDARAGRIYLSDGLRSVAKTWAAGPSDVSYVEGAIVPKGPWEEADDAILDRLVQEPSASEPASSIRITEPPDDVVEALYNLDIQEAESQEEVSEICSKKSYSNALRDVKKYAKEISIRKKGIKVLGVSIKPPGLPTVTVNQKTKRRIGLHLDSWDQLPLTKRREARNRISINMSEEDRFLIFLPITISYILDYFEDEKINNVDPTKLMRKYMKDNDHRPAIKVRVSPGEAYIAPTENMIHDATTIGRRNPDFNLSLLGYFRTDFTNR